MKLIVSGHHVLVQSAGDIDVIPASWTFKYMGEFRVSCRPMDEALSNNPSQSYTISLKEIESEGSTFPINQSDELQALRDFSLYFKGSSANGLMDEINLQLIADYLTQIIQNLPK